MKLITNLAAAAILIILGAALIIGAYYGLTTLWHLFMQLESTTLAILLTGIVTVLSVAVIIAAGGRAAARSITRGQLAGERFEVYALAMEHARRYCTDPDAISADEWEKMMMELEVIGSDISLLAGGDGLSAFSDFEQAVAEKETDHDLLSTLFLQLLRSFRRDLGHAYAYNELRFEIPHLPKGEKAAKEEIRKFAADPN